jgi:hypothetical protein
MNNLGLGCDEITKMNADDFSDFAYAVSQGRGRGRMEASRNAERLNFAKWQTILLCSSNASVVDKLKSLKSTPDGELMRVIEYMIPETKLLTKQEADEKNAAAQARAADVQAAEANVARLTQLKSLQTIVAPFAGVITFRGAEIGALITTDSSRRELFRMAAVTPLRVFASVPQSYLRSTEATSSRWYNTSAVASGHDERCTPSRNPVSLSISPAKRASQFNNAIRRCPIRNNTPAACRQIDR